jgi:hypothetical protein
VLAVWVPLGHDPQACFLAVNNPRIAKSNNPACGSKQGIIAEFTLR